MGQLVVDAQIVPLGVQYVLRDRKLAVWLSPLGIDRGEASREVTMV